ncbi:DUF1178 family protein [Qipengyuania marisflavi]|uniref:DUF1178 family protein n=1 Tax=Qipengyuania marisflavi TaxID=2486356 RepID=A0A5S3P940_9SPHN|nr:DUF1178 family protein [Qipengyuania marisflavi]TMM49956.1 DUF1178 family protein [Qipengyuania marisflavi]
MIVFDLSCDEGHRFEGWFGSSEDYAAQQQRGLVSCPHCGSERIGKAPMAPSVPAKANTAPAEKPQQEHQLANQPMPPAVQKAFKALAEAQAKALEKSTWVGSSFAEKARSMHYGEETEAPIHGQATRAEAEEMAGEGIGVAPILFPVSPPDKLN